MIKSNKVNFLVFMFFFLPLVVYGGKVSEKEKYRNELRDRCEPIMIAIYEHRKEIIPLLEGFGAQLRSACVENALWLEDVIKQPYLNGCWGRFDSCLRCMPFSCCDTVTCHALRYTDGLEIDDERLTTETLASVEKFSQKFHLGKYNSGRKTVMLSLESKKNEDNEDSFLNISSDREVVIGYRRYNLKDEKSDVYRVYDGKEVHDVLYTDLNKKISENNSILLRIIHAPDNIVRKTDDLVETRLTKDKPVKTVVARSVQLNKTGEVFTKPEIKAFVYYYDEKGKVVRVSCVDLLFVHAVGINRGFSKLIDWQRGECSMVILLVEDDRQIPYDILVYVAKKIARTVKYVTMKSSGFGAIYQEICSLIPNESDVEGNSDFSLIAQLKKFQEPDFIDVSPLILRSKLNELESTGQDGCYKLLVMRHNTRIELQLFSKRDR